MASIRDYAVTIYSAVTASMVCEMPTHVTGDLLVAFVNKDTASNFTTPSGWTASQTQTSAGSGGGVYVKRAASSSEAVTFALTSETCCGVVIAVRNVNGSTEADAVSGSAKSGADDSTLPLAGIGITPSHNNCLVLHGLSTDSGIGAGAYPPWINLFMGDAGANSLCVSYTQQKTAAAITAPNHWANVADDSRGFVIAIRDDGNGDFFDAYLPLSTTPSRLISPLTGSATTAVEKGAYTVAASTTLTTIAGKTVTGVTIGTAVADSGLNPFRGSNAVVGASSTTNLAHTEFVLTATDNLTQLSGLVFGTWFHATPRDYVDSGKAIQGGKYLVIGNDSSNYRAWVIGGQFTKTDKPADRNVFMIEVGSSDTIYGSAGSPDYTTADFFAFGSAGYYGAVALRFSQLYLIGEITLAGGADTNPFNFDQLVFAIVNGNEGLPLIQQTGSGGLIWAPLKFGNAVTTADPIFIACNLNTFQMPRKADEVDYVDFHISNNKIGYEFDGQDRGSGDVDILHFTNCVFTSPSSYYWRFASTHDTGANIDFSGSSVVNATVTLRSTVTLNNITFIDCPSFTLNSAALTNSTFDNSKVSTSVIAELADIQNSAFVSVGTGYAIEVTGTAGDVTLTGLTFTGYAGTNGTTGNEAIFVNIASGTCNISISGGTAPSIRTAGATVNVTNAVTVRVTVLDVNTGSPIENARVFLETDPGGTDIFNALTSAAGIVENTAYNYTADVDVIGRVRKGSSAPYYKTSPIAGTITEDGFGVTVFLIPDA